MCELKKIFDPEGLLNQGVIFNDDPECFIKCLKPLPVLDYDFDRVPDGGEYLKLGEGKKSYAVSFTFQNPDKTFTDKEIDKMMENLRAQFEKQLGAQIR
jgi:hypothetical protein